MAARALLVRFGLAAAFAGCGASTTTHERGPARAGLIAPAGADASVAPARAAETEPKPMIDIAAGDADGARAHIVVMQVGLDGRGAAPAVRAAITEQLARHPLLTADERGARSHCLPTLRLDVTATLDRSSPAIAEIDLRWLVSSSRGRMIGLVEQTARLEARGPDTDQALWQLGLESILAEAPSKLIALGGAAPDAGCSIAAAPNLDRQWP